DQPFLVGATNPDVPAYKPCFLALIQHFHELGIAELNGHLLYAIAAGEHNIAREWLERRGILSQAAEAASSYLDGKETLDAMFDRTANLFLEAWEDEAGLNTFGEAVAEVIEFRAAEGEPVEISPDEWRRFAARASLSVAREKARDLGIEVEWDSEAARTPEGYYQVRGGIPYAIPSRLRRRRSRICCGWKPRPRISKTRASSPKQFTPNSPTRCSRTICRPHSVGTPPA